MPLSMARPPISSRAAGAERALIGGVLAGALSQLAGGVFGCAVPPGVKQSEYG